MEVDDAREARTPHAGSGAHPLAAAFGLNRSPLTPGGLGNGDLFSPLSVLATINGHSGLKLVLPKGACARRGVASTQRGTTDELRRATQTSRLTRTSVARQTPTRHGACAARVRRVRGPRLRPLLCA
jgi:hypothetical protein